MREIVYTNRSNLVKTFLDLRFSQSTKHEIMLLFGNLKTHEEKEEAAKRATPLLKACKTEEEAIAAVARVIEEMTE